MTKDIPDKEIILDNYFNITDRDLLNKVEFELVTHRIIELNNKVTGNFDIKHLQLLHKTLFQDIYPWAGSLRTGGFFSTSRVLENGEEYVVEYLFSDYLEHHINKELGNLKQDKFFISCKNKEDFCCKIAYLYKELDFLHPFLEGNSRTLREFIRQVGDNAGYNINWSKTFIAKDHLYKARDIAVNNNDATYLINIFKEIVDKNKITKNIDFTR